MFDSITNFLKNVGGKIVSGAKSVLDSLSASGGNINNLGSAIGGFAGIGNPIGHSGTQKIGETIVSGIKKTGDALVQTGYQGNIGGNTGAPGIKSGPVATSQPAPFQGFGGGSSGGYGASGTYTAPPPIVSQPAYRPVTPTNRVDAYGRESNRDVGNPYTLDNGQVVTPKQGFSGFSGAGGSGMEISAPAAQGQTGFGGVSAHTGLLGAAGGMGTPSVNVGTTDDDMRRREEEAIKTKLLKQQSYAQTAPINVPPIGNQFNIADIQKTISSGRQLLGISEANVGDDRQSLLSNIDTLLEQANTAKAQQLAQMGDLVKETPDQLNFLNQFPPEQRLDLRQFMDAKRVELNIPELNKTELGAVQQLQSLNEVYNKFYDDVKNNPDLPAGLAKKRLDSLQKDHKKQFDQLNNVLEVTRLRLKDANDMLDREFNIAKLEQDENERMLDNARSIVQGLISSNAIGGMSDAELAIQSKQSGYPLSALKKARNAANDPKVSVDVITDDNGNVRGIDKSTGKVVWTVNGAGKQATTGDAKQYQYTAANYASRLEQSNQIFDKTATAVSQYNPAQLLAYRKADQIGGVAAIAVPNDLKSQFQAERNFLNAVLRRESGAVISPAEFENGARQYFPQPGDSEAILNQKKQNRLLVQRNFISEAGVAYRPSPNLNTANTSTAETRVLNGHTYQKVNGGWQLVQ